MPPRPSRAADSHSDRDAATGSTSGPPFDVDDVRRQFPALLRCVNGHQVAYLDGPGGTQTPRRVIDAVADYLVGHNANIHGQFAASRETDGIIDESRGALADFLGAVPDEISFGANMTTLTMFVAQSLVRDWAPGDEVVITALDHEADRGPWLDLRERGIVVREVPIDIDRCTLDREAFESLVNERTRLVALGYASNAVGTVNDVVRAARLAHTVGALCFVDAVHYALHGPIDVEALECDFLVCSPYKFFGPHLGVLWVKRSAGERIRPLSLSTQDSTPPCRYETGTLCHEGIAGAREAVEFVADLGRRAAGEAGLHRRAAVVAGMRATEQHERPLTRRLIDGLTGVPGVRVYGPPADGPRTSTVSFTVPGMPAQDVAGCLGELGIFVWDGDFYAARFVELAGLADRGGLVRIGLCPYNTADEVERAIAAVADLAGMR